MANKEKIIPAGILNVLDEMDSVQGQGEKEVDDFILAAGYDPNEIAQKGVSVVKRALARKKIEQAKKNRTNLLSRATKILEQKLSKEGVVPGNHVKIISLFKDLSDTRSQAFYSKLDSFNCMDAAQLLTDQELLKLIESLDSEDAK